MNRAVTLAAIRAVQEAKGGAAEHRVIAVGGARELVPLLARRLRDGGGDPAAVSETFRSDAAAFVWIGKPDEHALRTASLARIPIVGVTEGERLPYVLDTNLVAVPAGQGLPVEEIAAALARVLGPAGTGLAARLPVLRAAVVDRLIKAAAQQNARAGVAAGVTRVALPILTLNQVRLVVGIAAASGRKVDAGLVPELIGVLGAAYGWRQLARALDWLPVPAALVRGGVAVGGTLAVGAAARRRLA
jgi:hypothetical protein